MSRSTSAVKYNHASEDLDSDLLDEVAKAFLQGHHITLTDIQKDCIKEVVCNRKNLFATLPTGSGKTMIFVGAVMAEQLRGRGSVSILVVPILALLYEHLETLKKFGIKAIDLQDKDQSISMETFAESAPTVVVTFPETLFSNEGKDMIEKAASKIRYFAIDEVHLLYFWGDITGNKSADVFRSTFTQMRDLFIKFKVQPILINLTATLTSGSTKKILKHLAISPKDTYMVNKEPLGANTNIIIMDRDTKFSLDALFLYFNEKLDDKRIIIFCRSLTDCGALNRDITYMFGNKFGPIVRVLTAETDKSIKDEIISDLQNEAGTIRLMIATSTLSMGVNIKGAKYVIQLGMPTSFEEFIQKCGRCGREGEAGYAMIYPWFSRAHPQTDTKFREFCRTKKESCLKQQIGEHFGELAQNTCGSCSRCKPKSEDTFVDLLKTYNASIDDDIQHLAIVRHVSKESRSFFEEELRNVTKRRYQQDFYGTPAIGYPVLSHGCIALVLKRLDKIGREDDINDIVEDADVRREILLLIYDFFRDIPEPSIDFQKTIPKTQEEDFGTYFNENAEDESDDELIL